MSVPFLSEEWFACARERLSDALPERPGVSARIVYEATGPSRVPLWSQVVVDGLVEHWGRGPVDDPDVTVRWDVADALGVLRSTMDGTEALDRATVVTERDGTRYAGPPPPMDMTAVPELAALPRVPGASLAVQYELRAGPFGPASFYLVFEDGRVASADLDRLPSPDVTVELPYRTFMEVRAGSLGVVEALARGRIAGDETSIILLGGLLETEPYQRVQRSCRGGGLALGALGEVAAAGAYRAAMTELAAETGDPDA
jgi:putative sterol carrier protein